MHSKCYLSVKYQIQKLHSTEIKALTEKLGYEKYLNDFGMLCDLTECCVISECIPVQNLMLIHLLIYFVAPSLPQQSYSTFFFLHLFFK